VKVSGCFYSFYNITKVFPSSPRYFAFLCKQDFLF
jgi:hypothetical protein